MRANVVSKMHEEILFITIKIHDLLVDLEEVTSAYHFVNYASNYVLSRPRRLAEI